MTATPEGNVDIRSFGATAENGLTAVEVATNLFEYLSGVVGGSRPALGQLVRDLVSQAQPLESAQGDHPRYTIEHGVVRLHLEGPDASSLILSYAPEEPATEA